MIKIYIPKDFTKINEYASKIIFEEIFGLSYKIFTHSKNEIGSMALDEVPWDGMYLMDRSIKWTKLSL